VHTAPQPLPDSLRETSLSTGTLTHQRDWLGRRHIGTLGGGNHFIELQRDTLNRLWVTVHSGSRGIGAAIASHHARAATLDTLPFIEAASQEAAAFLSDLNWALDFASENRKRMMEQVVSALTDSIGKTVSHDFFDVAHNVITQEIHGGRTLFVHRKGAMPAAAGMRGIIPGSMGTASYIVEGLGNLASYASCSHGAGRLLSRSEARKRISLKDLRRQMQHVVYSDEHSVVAALVEEAPAAYKDIKAVLKQQSDLVKPVLRLEPLAVIKGGGT
jgi:tRNA-splicing ligase RtcB (3'-phosphate/5'-hydroxy nucleic acid ligase)